MVTRPSAPPLPAYARNIWARHPDDMPETTITTTSRSLVLSDSKLRHARAVPRAQPLVGVCPVPFRRQMNRIQKILVPELSFSLFAVATPAKGLRTGSRDPTSSA